jgi:hypothetical protein
MPTYNGYRLACHCTCARCGRETVLEGFDDADGCHYCYNCDDYVSVTTVCPARTPEKVQARQARIDAYHAAGGD